MLKSHNFMLFAQFSDWWSYLFYFLHTFGWPAPHYILLNYEYQIFGKGNLLSASTFHISVSHFSKSIHTLYTNWNDN